MINLKHIIFNYDKVIFLAPNDVTEFLNMANACEVDAIAYDYDPKFSKTPFYVNKDFVFDDVDMDAELFVHMNVEKTYPVKLPRGADVILIGDNEEHNGDCTPIHSCQRLIDLYNVGEVYDQGHDENETHYYVYGKIDENRIR